MRVKSKEDDLIRSTLRSPSTAMRLFPLAHAISRHWGETPRDGIAHFHAAEVNPW
jgi:hypothetical protein